MQIRAEFTEQELSTPKLSPTIWARGVTLCASNEPRNGLVTRMGKSYTAPAVAGLAAYFLSLRHTRVHPFATAVNATAKLAHDLIKN